jgi:PST family polysaccharide transporter
MTEPGPPRRGPSLRSRAIGSAFWLFSGTAVQAVLRLLVLSLLARMLGPEDFGLAAAALIVIGFFQILLRTGIRPAVIQRPELSDVHVRSAFAMSLALGIILASAVVLASEEISNWVFDMPELAPILSAVALLLPLQSIGVVAAALLERELNFSWIVRINVISYTFGYGLVGLVMASTGYGVWSLVGAYLAQEFLKTILALWARPHPMRPSLNLRASRELVYFGFGFALARMGNFGALNGDKWIVARWLGSESLGFYKYAFELTAMIANLFGSVLDRVLFPAMARLQGDAARLGLAFRQGVGMVGVLVFPTSALLVVVAPEVIRTILGDGWDPVIVPFRVLALVLPISATYTISDSLARATGVVYKRAWRQFIFAGAVLGLSWYGQRWGLPGLAVGVGCATLLNQILMLYLSRSVTELGWWELGKAHLGALPAFFVSGGIAFGVVSLFREMAMPNVVSLGVTTLTVGLVMLIPLKLAPRLLVGPDGVRALAAIIEFLGVKFPKLLTNGLLRRILPIREMTDAGGLG